MTLKAQDSVRNLPIVATDQVLFTSFLASNNMPIYAVLKSLASNDISYKYIAIFKSEKPMLEHR